MAHPAQRRYLAEDLVRRRRSDEQRRYAAPQRAAKIDPNPHQVDAVIFALGRLREGGCILADEVGLGKTIEAGLVIAQRLAEGARRVLLIAPKPLLGQWRQELAQLFEIDAREARPTIGGFDGEGVLLIGREAAGSERGRDAMLASEPFDLCIIDEAHEVFAGLYKRYDELGRYDLESPHAQTAGRVREVLAASRTPVLLLTATPIQNSLAELWGLVQFVDPLGTLLGDLPTFRAVFCGVDDRHLAAGQEGELRGRLRSVLQRTLRRQVQELLEKPFVDRQARLFEYSMSAEERALYDDVATYLLEPGIVAFRGGQRQLALLGFHRRMASSSRALAESLANVAERLRAERDGRDPSLVRAIDDELDDDEAAPIEGGEPPPPWPARSALDAEIARLEGFIARAAALGGDDAKLGALFQALGFVGERAASGRGSPKLVIFTESCVTQDYLRDRLVASGLVTADEVTLFRGQNDSPRALEALARWRAEKPAGTHDDASADVAVRLALVHEFKTRSRVFISTDAGGKGLNLQFCDTVVNYDLPWNPQRIEQRIGRCHRYGQRHDVTVINFLGKDNEAQRLTFELLSRKLELFGAVLDASDQVLHRPEGGAGDGLAGALGADFEAQIRRIYARARTIDEIEASFRALREQVAEDRRRFQETHARTASLIERRLDEDVQRVFRSHQAAMPVALAELDRDLRAVVVDYLEAVGASFTIEATARAEVLGVDASAALPGELSAGLTVAVGGSKEHRSLHAGHPLVVAAVASARARSSFPAARVRLSSDAPASLAEHDGQRAVARVFKLGFEGFEEVESLVPVVVFADGTVLDPRLGDRILRGELEEVEVAPASIDGDSLDDATEAVLTHVQREVDAAEDQRFRAACQQAERFLDDRLLVLRRRRAELTARIEAAEARRDGATGFSARTEAERALASIQKALEDLEAAIDKLERRDDDTFRRYQDHIQGRRYSPPKREHLFDLDLVIEGPRAEGARP